MIDIEGHKTQEEVFQAISEALSERLGVAPATIHQKLVEREQQSHTAITPSLAIPHIIVEGERGFDLLMARCREGIEFSESAPNVRAVFVLAGSMDERNFHLQALAAIAQIVQDPHFDRRWLEARTKEDLRDIVLLGKRRR